KLGMGAGTLARFDHLINQPHGIVLVTGPTGSGKTTTLYAALSRLDAASTNIMTVEGPDRIRFRASRSWRSSTLPRNACRRTGASRCAWAVARLTCA
ncbi:hypothetical protein DCS65_21505, partial [Bacillus subtilis]